MAVKRRCSHWAGLLLPWPAQPGGGGGSPLGLPVTLHPEGQAWGLLHGQRGLQTVPPAELSHCHGVQSNWRQHSIMPKWGEGPGRQMDGPISQLGRQRWSVTQRQAMTQARAQPGRSRGASVCLPGPQAGVGAQAPSLPEGPGPDPLPGEAGGAETKPSPFSPRCGPGFPQPPLQSSGSRVEGCSAFTLQLRAPRAQAAPTHPLTVVGS